MGIPSFIPKEVNFKGESFEICFKDNNFSSCFIVGYESNRNIIIVRIAIL